jgi:hypothetical protein
MRCKQAGSRPEYKNEGMQKIRENGGNGEERPRPIGYSGSKEPTTPGTRGAPQSHYYGFREQVEAGEISPHFVPTAGMPADTLTKALT